MTPLRLLAILVVVLSGGFVLTVSLVAQRLRLPTAFVARAILKQTAELGIAIFTRIVDPCEPPHTSLGPEGPDLAGLERRRLEEYFAGTRSFPSSPGRSVRLGRVHNERIVRSHYPFRYQPFEEPRLHQLREHYQLDKVMASGGDEFGGLVQLRNWTRSQFRRRDYQPWMRYFDALGILERSLRNDAAAPYDGDRYMDPCIFFPMLYCQLVLSVGHQARICSIRHGVAEVWSNQHCKWVAMDVELNHHFEKDGVPLSLMDLHDEIFAPRPSRARLVRGEQSSGDVSTSLVHLGVWELSADTVIGWHHLITITDMRNDWLTNHYFPAHPARSDPSTLIYQDPRSENPELRLMPLRQRTRRKDDLGWTLNQTEVLVRVGSDAATVRLAFDTVTPNFDFFELTTDGDHKLRTSQGTHDWKLHTGLNTLTVRTVNKFGVPGIPSRVELLVEEAVPCPTDPRKDAADR
jgi:hypothetical protein